MLIDNRKIMKYLFFLFFLVVSIHLEPDALSVFPAGNLIESIKVQLEVSFFSLRVVGADWAPRDASAPTVSRRAARSLSNRRREKEKKILLLPFGAAAAIFFFGKTKILLLLFSTFFPPLLLMASAHEIECLF